MIISRIELHNYRNYGRLELSVGPSVNIVYGDNGQGKTNLLEAINVCSCITSHRTSKDRDLIKLGSNEYELTLDLIDPKDSYKTTIMSGFYSEKSSLIGGNTARRVLKQDGIQISKVASYLGLCNTVIFAPEDLNIVKGAPANRRKFLNMMISKVSPSYFDLLTRTNKLINQKNAYLKSCMGQINNADNNSLEFWDFSLSDLTADMIISRYRFVKMLAQYTNKHHTDISGGKENVSISYETITGSIELLDNLYDELINKTENISQAQKTALEREIRGKLSNFILEKFRASRKNDIEKGITTIGIHRDDIDIKLNNLSMRVYSSQGQQRTAALSLKLSELDIINEITSSKPVLLLDEVFAELDINRRIKLISGMTDAQIFITCTDKTYIVNEISNYPGFNNDIRYFHVTDGDIISD